MRKLEPSGVIMLDADEMVASSYAWKKRRAELRQTVLPAGDGLYTFAAPPLLCAPKEFWAELVRGHDELQDMSGARLIGIEVLDGQATLTIEHQMADTPAEECGCNGTPE